MVAQEGQHGKGVTVSSLGQGGWEMVLSSGAEATGCGWQWRILVMWPMAIKSMDTVGCQVQLCVCETDKPERGAGNISWSQ